jgi:N-methylhydantoinase A/oxoprolinase/acetone carboxylase beta subunit
VETLSRPRVGIDVGGTFTDVVAIDGNRLVVAKLSSTPDDPAVAVLRGLQDVLTRLGTTVDALDLVAHGTTVATNAALERKGARVGFLTTAGFEDVIEIGRLQRTAIYDLQAEAETPTFVAPRRARFGIPERVGADGQVIVKLDEAAVASAVDRLVQQEGVTAIAVGYLFAFLHPEHERRTREIVLERHPGFPVSISSEVDPRVREYERFATTLFDAYLKPLVADYLARLETSGIQRLRVMRSSGGLCDVAEAANRPIALLQSGLAAGVLGACATAVTAGFTDAITVDIGGTSCDVALIANGVPGRRSEIRIGTIPVRTATIDVHTIGAGGGSIAWLDGSGGLRVGPESAGAVPGPACYGAGGARPTVTDASLVLGYIGADRFAGGSLRLDRSAAAAAISPLAAALGLTLEDAAAGIHRVLNAAMTDEIRRITLHRGADPREFALVLLGGGGPLHGAELGADLGIRDLIVPQLPGLQAAAGLLAAPFTHEQSIAFRDVLTPALAARLQEACGTLDRRGRAALGDAADLAARLSAHMRYAGQSHELEVPLPDTVGSDLVATLRRRFEQMHTSYYGRSNPDRAIEITGLMASHSVPAQPISLDRPPRRGSLVEAWRDDRPVYDWRRRAWQPTPVYDRDALPDDAVLAGPAIVEQLDATLLLPAGAVARVLPSGALLMRLDCAG